MESEFEKADAETADKDLDPQPGVDDLEGTGQLSTSEGFEPLSPSSPSASVLNRTDTATYTAGYEDDFEADTVGGETSKALGMDPSTSFGLGGTPSGAAVGKDGFGGVDSPAAGKEADDDYGFESDFEPDAKEAAERQAFTGQGGGEEEIEGANSGYSFEEATASKSPERGKEKGDIEKIESGYSFEGSPEASRNLELASPDNSSAVGTSALGSP
jgi:hypothetical protein